MKNLIEKISVKKNVMVKYGSHTITVKNWWNLFTGHSISLDEKIIISKFFWFPNMLGNEENFVIDDSTSCRVVFGQKWYGFIGIHVYINNDLKGGDVDNKLYWVKS